MRTPIVVPDLKVPTLVLSVWYVKLGEPVIVGERVVELLVNGATFDVTADCAGTLMEQCAWPDETLAPMQVLGFIDAVD